MTKMNHERMRQRDLSRKARAYPTHAGTSVDITKTGKVIVLEYDSRCLRCSAPIAADTEALWFPQRGVQHLRTKECRR